MSMNHTLIDLARARLAEAEDAYSGGDSDRHTASAQAAATIAQAAASIVIAETLAEIAPYLARLAECDDDDRVPSIAEAVEMASLARQYMR